jgi:3-methylcrotonyl-CoA carboxylase alpha subunit
MFDKILIANRGEIACRVARTARRMGIRTVAVFSEADARALHVAACDEAVLLGPPAPRESYLRGDRIIAAALERGAQAIHPGYGFLSENEDFAQACADAGLVFIGPPPPAIRAMGSKSESKRIMGAAGVPLVPGYHGAEQDLRLLEREAEQIGYPVLIKASAGGGGKGMRIVERPRDFEAALASAKREAASSFGDDAVLLEKYLTEPRHIEIQVFADRHGECVYLFERDCSVQRRHQKVLEEAPAPGMTAERRAAMGAAAVAACKAIGYEGAGTVEFIANQDGSFYFMEMNTRLQVEHPVTEMITGLDLVEWQLRVAAGELLPLAQEDLAIHGHAIEARIYAEDPERGFLPSIGHIAHLFAPETSAFVRIDTGVRAGDEISPWYDPMIAKLIAWGEDRELALKRLRVALSQYRIVGLATNVEFLHRLTGHHAFAQAKLDTGLIGRHHEELFPPQEALPDSVLAIAALAHLESVEAAARERAAGSGEPASPWHATDGWWLNEDNYQRLDFIHRGEEKSVVAHYRGGERLLDLPGGQVRARAERDADALSVDLGGARSRAHVVEMDADLIVFVDGRSHRLTLLDPLAVDTAAEGGGGHLAAPMSGTVVAVHVKPGERVQKGASLLILEAMKMEHAITAPAAGVVGQVFYKPGEQVPEGAELVTLQREEGAS